MAIIIIITVHLLSGCRYKAEVVNTLFAAHLEQFVIKPDYKELFTEVIIDTYNQQNNMKDSHSELVKEIDVFNEKLKKARELLLAGDIDAADYKIIKFET